MFRGVLPSWLSLAVQAAILAATAVVSWRLQRGLAIPNRYLGEILFWLAAAYLALVAGRLASCLNAPHAVLSFWDWVGTAIHAVLGGFVLTLSLYHRREAPAW